MAVGLSVLMGSRGPVIGLLLAFFLAIEPLLAAIGFLGGARGFLPTIAVERIGHMPAHNGLTSPSPARCAASPGGACARSRSGPGRPGRASYRLAPCPGLASSTRS